MLIQSFTRVPALVRRRGSIVPKDSTCHNPSGTATTYYYFSCKPQLLFLKVVESIKMDILQKFWRSIMWIATVTNGRPTLLLFFHFFQKKNSLVYFYMKIYACVLHKCTIQQGGMLKICRFCSNANLVIRNWILLKWQFLKVEVASEW